MKTYTFYLQDGPETMPAFEIEVFEDSEQARAHAHKLLAERVRYDRVIVTEEVVEVARFERPAIAASAQADQRYAAG